MRSVRPIRRLSPSLGTYLFAAALCGLAACSGDTGPAGPAGPPGPQITNTDLARGDDTPGLVLSVLSVSGGTLSGGHFKAGDKPVVHFRVQKNDGSDWNRDELSSGKIMLSGPSFNYQRVVAELSDLLTACTVETDGSFTYRFASAIPTTYLPPLGDSPAFGTDDGELAGQALLDGTYTFGLTVSWSFTVDGVSKKDAANATFDVLFGASSTIVPREVVKLDNCNRCHEQLRWHGGTRVDTRLCVLCHTSGAEDALHQSIDFRVMIHKLHAGEHLPSVLGVATNPDGSRNYGAPPTPYVVSGTDFSHVAFPAWPQGLVPMPRDMGYSALSAQDKATEDTIREGPSNCIVCHGDPDGSGPLTAPAQGDQYKVQTSRNTCGSCHDDIAWGQPYTSNGQTMGAQANNANCALCHAASGNPLAVEDAHLHPNLDPTFDPGLVLDVTGPIEAGTNDGDGTIDPGEKMQITLRIHDDAGNDFLPSAISNPTVVISGPTSNYNLLLNTTLPTAALTGSPPYTVNLPMPVQLERAGVSTGALESFVTAFTPHWNVAGGTTTVYVRTGVGVGNSVLAAASAAPQNYVDLASTSGFARDDYVVIQNGGGANEEYAKVQLVDGNRLWFSSPYSGSYKTGLEKPHAAGSVVRNVTLVTKTAGVDYTLTPATGTITELVEFGAGDVVLVSYTTDFVMPATYPIAINASPDLGDESGKWTGKPIVDGTYTLGIWSSRTLTLNLYGETNSYKSTSDSANKDFLVGSAATLEPYALISSGTNCFNCHQELAFHGNGRRDFGSCVLCHGSAGAEDRPQYVAAGAPATTGVTVGFRNMLHKIHMGSQLSDPAAFQIVGFGSGSYPNNFSVASFEDVAFPALPGGVQNCAKCHGNDAWKQPAERAHPTHQDVAIKRWSMVCGSCHDSSDAQAHISINTDGAGNESCGVCHGLDRDFDVARAHKPY